MNRDRRHFLRLTAAGLIHVSGRPLWAGEEPYDAELLIRLAAERGHTDLGWLNSYHSFSFGRYVNQRQMGFRSLRVINDDRIVAGRGFPTHPHRDMEILSYVLGGALQHRDSTGRGSVVRPDDVQVMAAGTGITHSEYNPSGTEENHFLQVWIRPAMRGVRPRYQQRRVGRDAKRDVFRAVAGPEASAGVVGLNQDARVYATVLGRGGSVGHTVERGRHGWLQVASGELSVNGVRLRAGDAVATSRPTRLEVTAAAESEALLFDLG
ncbi:MAG: pirin family protein [Planctomycetota bacterium]